MFKICYSKVIETFFPLIWGFQMQLWRLRMTAPKTTALLNDASVVAVVGTRPHATRKSLKLMVSALVLASVTTLGFVSNATAQNYQNQGYSNQQVVQNQPIPATVVKVTQVRQQSQDIYERRNQQAVDRTNNLVGTAVGAVLGGVLGDKVGNGRGRGYARTLGTIGGGVIGNQLGKMTDRRRNQQEQQVGNVRHVQNAYDVTVNLQLGGGQVEQVVITQSNGEFRRGDQVLVVPHNDGTASVQHAQQQYNSRVSYSNAR